MRLSIKDIDFVDMFLNDPEIYKYITDDSTNGRVDALRLFKDESVYVLSPDPNSLFIFHPMSYIIYQGHMQCKKTDNGEQSWILANEAIEWMFSNTECKKIIGFTPTYCQPAVQLALKCGFEIEGYLTKSIMKNKRLCDQVITGLTKDKWGGLWE